MTDDRMIAELARALRRALLDEMAAEAQNQAYFAAIMREDEREAWLEALAKE